MSHLFFFNPTEEDKLLAVDRFQRKPEGDRLTKGFNLEFEGQINSDEEDEYAGFNGD